MLRSGLPITIHCSPFTAPSTPFRPVPRTANHPAADEALVSHWNVTTLIESARVGADSLRANPLRTVLATTGVIIGVAALVAAFAITDGVDVWSRALIARESSVQDVAITPITSQVINGRLFPVRGYPMFDAADADRARAEIPGVIR